MGAFHHIDSQMTYSVFSPNESDECTTQVIECMDLKQLWFFYKQKEDSGMLKSWR